MSKFKIGDVCFLKGGSCALTVIALLGRKSDDVEVMWFTDLNEGQRAVLSEAAVMTEAELVAQNQQHDLLSASGGPPFKRCQ